MTETITEFKHKGILIKITQASIKKQNGNIYEAARKAWIISKKNANEAEYVLAVYDEVVVGIFALTGKWHESSSEAGRKEFEGEPAPANIQELYKNKLIPQEYRKNGARNPIRYTWDVNKKRGKK
jgi:hypothetical protein